MIHSTMIHSSTGPEGLATYHAILDTPIPMPEPTDMVDTMDMEITSIQPIISIEITATIFISPYLLTTVEATITALEEAAL